MKRKFRVRDALHLRDRREGGERRDEPLSREIGTACGERRWRSADLLAWRRRKGEKTGKKGKKERIRDGRVEEEK